MFCCYCFDYLDYQAVAVAVLMVNVASSSPIPRLPSLAEVNMIIRYHMINDHQVSYDQQILQVIKYDQQLQSLQRLPNLNIVIIIIIQRVPYMTIKYPMIIKYYMSSNMITIQRVQYDHQISYVHQISYDHQRSICHMSQPG